MSRMLMNYQLMSERFLPISIPKESRPEYYDALEEYAVNGDLSSFAEIVAALEEARLKGYLSLASADGKSS